MSARSQPRQLLPAAASLGALSEIRRGLLPVAVVAFCALWAAPAQSQDATWDGPGSDYNTAGNWNPMSVPGNGDTAFFGAVGPTNVTFSQPTFVGGWTFNVGANDYEFATTDNVTFINGAGIAVNGGSATIINTANLSFEAGTTAGSADITNNNDLTFNDDSTAGSATITNALGEVIFADDATALKS